MTLGNKHTPPSLTPHTPRVGNKLPHGAGVWGGVCESETTEQGQ